jgi:preprotein translocase subunit SecE
MVLPPAPNGRRHEPVVRAVKLEKGSIMAKAGPMEFFRQVKSEAKKVTWPSRKETTVSTVAVFIMVFIAAVFLYFSDQVIAFLVRLIMSIGLS